MYMGRNAQRTIPIRCKNYTPSRAKKKGGIR